MSLKAHETGEGEFVSFIILIFFRFYFREVEGAHFMVRLPPRLPRGIYLQRSMLYNMYRYVTTQTSLKITP